MHFTPRGKLLLPRPALTQTNSDFPSLLCVDLAGSRTPSPLVRKTPPSHWEPLRQRSRPNRLLSDGSPRPPTSCNQEKQENVLKSVFQYNVQSPSTPFSLCDHKFRRNYGEVNTTTQHLLYLQTDVHQLIQFRAAALVQVSAACMALVHQVSQYLYGSGTFRVAHALKLQHARSFAVHMLGSLVQLETCH